MEVAVPTVSLAPLCSTDTTIFKNVLFNIRCYVTVGLDPDISPDEQEEKARLIAQVLELQNTLDGE